MVKGDRAPPSGFALLFVSTRSFLCAAQEPLEFKIAFMPTSHRRSRLLGSECHVERKRKKEFPGFWNPCGDKTELTFRIADDFVTATIFGTGGLDASIAFETTRDENVGPAFVDSLTRFSYYFNQKVSSKDQPKDLPPYTLLTDPL